MTEEITKELFALMAQAVRELGSMAPEDTRICPSFFPYFQESAGLLCRLLEEWECLQKERESGKEPSLELLRARNLALYEDLLPEHYESCYGNPAYATACYGEKLGRLFSFVYAELHSQVAAVYEGELEELVIRMSLFLDLYQTFACAWEEGRQAPDYEELHRLLYQFISDYSDKEQEKRIKSQLDPKEDFLLRILMDSDLSDVRYLYRYGEYITGCEEELAVYLNSLPEETIEKLSLAFTEGYRMGFEAGGKDITKKKTVNIRYTAGFERIVRQAVLQFGAMGLLPVIYRASFSVFHKRGTARVGFCGAEVNPQYSYDHKEDEALYLDKRLVSKRRKGLESAYETYASLAAVHGGPACMEAFGETPFAPKAKPEALQLSPAQQKLSVEYAAAAGQIVNKYIKSEERSFTIIALPVPRIGAQFPQIFEAVTAINTLDYGLYQRMQQIMIDALDQAETVRIVGCNGNRTDLTVALATLADPKKETLFENCVADVNIPVGEVFTSPRLAGTCGVLHVSRVFLNELEYRDLELTFEDGMIRHYTCGNFASEEENRRYVKENVLFYHDTLPMGEFAIGTNTTAYVAARKFQMEDKLPILIAEKTGPHFAVGDTCYSHCEELAVYNPDGKEIIARDNACSARRRENLAAAYFNCHTDITIPYEELGELSAICSDGRKIEIIRQGRFVLAGCEALNAPLENEKG